MLLAALLSLSLAAAPPLVAVLDPGHGGTQDGASGPGGLKEKILTLQIARRVARRLERGGARVLLTRDRDETVPLAQRAALANARRADLFLSIHLNSMPGPHGSTTHGVETYFLSADATDESASAVAARENADRLAGLDGPDPGDPVELILQSLGDAEALDESSKLAYAIQGSLVSRLKAEDRGVKQAPFYVLAGARMAAVLVEAGFLSDPSEARRLARPSYQDEIASAIAQAVWRWRRSEPPR